MIFRYHSRSIPGSPPRAYSLAALVAAAGVVAVAALPFPVHAVVLDFGQALQPLAAGTIVSTVTLDNAATMTVSAEHPEDGPDICIIFDSAQPTGGDRDLGTPNEDFGGPGKGEGGEEGERGENDVALGKLLIVPEDDEDADGDGLIDVPDDEPDGGLVRLSFSHAGRLSFDLVDVDKDEDEPEFRVYKEGQLVGTAEGEDCGDNSLQHVDLSAFGDIDAVEIQLFGSAGIGAIELDVILVEVQTRPWSQVKQTYR